YGRKVHSSDSLCEYIAYSMEATIRVQSHMWRSVKSTSYRPLNRWIECNHGNPSVRPNTTQDYKFPV
ncbi:hypothetical protein CHUAL_009435, partial [Chamberlinius hualienensis]